MVSYFKVEKVHYVEALGSRVNMIEAERQQSEARVKEEVDASRSAWLDERDGGLGPLWR